VFQDLFEPLLDRGIAEATPTISNLQIRDCLCVLVEGIEVGENHISLDAAWIGDSQMIGVRVHLPDGLRDLGIRCRKRNGVSQRLAHLGRPVDAGEPPDGGDQGAGLGQQMATDLPVDPADDLVRLLDQRCLVFADRYHCRLEGRDVGSLGSETSCPITA
jgi:hypothetical protein